MPRTADEETGSGTRLLLLLAVSLVLVCGLPLLWLAGMLPETGWKAVVLAASSIAWLPYFAYRLRRQFSTLPKEADQSPTYLFQKVRLRTVLALLVPIIAGLILIGVFVALY